MKREKDRSIPRAGIGVREIAEANGVSTGLVRLEIARGNLEAFRIGRRVLVKAESYDNYRKNHAG